MKISFRILIMTSALAWSSIALSAQSGERPVPFPLNEPVHIILKHDIQRHASVNGMIKEVQGNWIRVEMIDYQTVSSEGRHIRMKNRRLGWIAIDAIALVRLDAVEDTEELGEMNLDFPRRTQSTPDSHLAP